MTTGGTATKARAGPGPIEAALRAAIDRDGRSKSALARATGVVELSIAIFARGDRDPALATVEPLFAYFGIGVAKGSGDDGPWRSIEDTIRAALVGDGRSKSEVARAAGLSETKVCRFARGRRDGRRDSIRISTAEKLIAVLELEVITRAPARRPESAVPPGEPPRPIADAIRATFARDRATFARDGWSQSALARAAGISRDVIRRFFHDRDPKFATAVRLAGALGIRATPAAGGGPPRTIEEALRAALAGAGSFAALGRATGVDQRYSAGFARGEFNHSLAWAETLFVRFGLELAHEERPGPVAPPSAAELREACASGGVTAHALARRSGISYTTTRRLLDGADDLKPDTRARLAHALVIGPPPPAAVTPGPPAAGPAYDPDCPIRLGDVGAFPVVDGIAIPVSLTKAERDILAVLASGYPRQAYEYDDLGERSDVAAPRRVIERMGKKPGYGPIAGLIDKSHGRPIVISLRRPSADPPEPPEGECP